MAATVSTDDEAEEFRRFLDKEDIADEDRVIRRVALRGFATEGVALARMDLMPEITITAEGVYWHPVGAEDADLLVTRDIFPLADAFAAVREAFDRESAHGRRLTTIFNCAEEPAARTPRENGSRELRLRQRRGPPPPVRAVGRDCRSSFRIAPRQTSAPARDQNRVGP